MFGEQEWSQRTRVVLSWCSGTSDKLENPHPFGKEEWDLYDCEAGALYIILPWNG